MLNQHVQSEKSAAMLILMGGRSTRMGTDKAQLLFEGQPFWRKIAGELSDCGEVYLSVSQTRDTQHLNQYACIRDLVPGAGVMGALYSAFHSIPEDLIFICACDMPYMNRSFVQWLLKRWHAEEKNGKLWDGIAVCEENGRIYTSAALYHRRICTQIDNNIRQNHLRMHTMVRDEANMLLVPSREVQEFISCFRNINTPEEYVQFVVHSAAAAAGSD